MNAAVKLNLLRPRLALVLPSKSNGPCRNSGAVGEAGNFMAKDSSRKSPSKLIAAAIAWVNWDDPNEAERELGGLVSHLKAAYRRLADQSPNPEQALRCQQISDILRELSRSEPRTQKSRVRLDWLQKVASTCRSASTIPRSKVADIMLNTFARAVGGKLDWAIAADYFLHLCSYTSIAKSLALTEAAGVVVSKAVDEQLNRCTRDPEAIVKACLRALGMPKKNADNFFTHVDARESRTPGRKS